MRVFKSAEEIEILRRNGVISAEAVKQAMLATDLPVMNTRWKQRPCMRSSNMGPKEPPILLSLPPVPTPVSGTTARIHVKWKPATCCSWILGQTWTTSAWISHGPGRSRASSLRSKGRPTRSCWKSKKPVSKPTDREPPWNTVQKHVAQVMSQKGLDPRGLKGGFGHFVGMATHDVGPRIERLVGGHGVRYRARALLSGKKSGNSHRRYRAYHQRGL